ncbi:MAG: T9SS type A sorting domain-containing protein [Fluviicola sp.]
MQRLLSTLACLTSLVCSTPVFSQNLVNNPSFEAYSVCPNTVGQLDLADDWQIVTGHTGNPDLFNSCAASIVSVPANVFGNQNANTGNGYINVALYAASIQANYREYAQGTLSSPLLAGETYCVSLFVSCPDNSNMASDNALEIYFSDTPLTGAGNFNVITGVTPQIQSTTLINNKTSWEQLVFTFTAAGGEQYLTIGNFKNDAATNAVSNGPGSFSTISAFIDDVSVEPIDDATITPVGPLCVTDPAITLTAADGGGVWSGTGITNSTTGTFDPSVAGVGTHTITYSIPGACGDSKTESIAVTDCSLPVELLEFDAQVAGQNLVRLTWVTFTEINNDYFEIERSHDGVNFTPIQRVNGAGNSSISLNYEELDDDPYMGISYYRLKQVDFNGSYSYSEIRSVVFEELSFVNLYPNPAENDLNIVVAVSSKELLRVEIIDMIGRIISVEEFAINAGVSTHMIKTNNLAGGVYTVRVNTNHKNHLSKEFIRN